MGASDYRTIQKCPHSLAEDAGVVPSCPCVLLGHIGILSGWAIGESGLLFPPNHIGRSNVTW